MTDEKKQIINITTEFIGPDGSKGTRSKMTDFQTLKVRIFVRIQKTAAASEPTIIPGINSYNEANYESALKSFIETIKNFPQLTEEITPHIEICKRVLDIPVNNDDKIYEDCITKWNNTFKLLKYFKKKPEYKIRCKYCGHYTLYIAPDDGFAYLGNNNCCICRRGYPAPDFVWDGIDGQAYIYYRNSVKEKEFYREFENRFEVNPDHTIFLKK